MPGRECFHCKAWIEAGQEHDCWTTTERALTKDLAEELQDAWERLRETAAAFGEQRIYASHKSIMFSRKTCYFFVRPNRKYLEICFFLGREVRAPQIRKAERSSRAKVWHILRVTHRDQVEAPITDWLREAYDKSDELSAASARSKQPARRAPKGVTKRAAARKRPRRHA